MILTAMVYIATHITTPELAREFPITKRDSIIVNDAITRWSEKIGADVAMRERIPIVIVVGKSRCVYLYLRPSSIGPRPLYCYKLDEDEFVEVWNEEEE